MVPITKKTVWYPYATLTLDKCQLQYNHAKTQRPFQPKPHQIVPSLKLLFKSLWNLSNLKSHLLANSRIDEEEKIEKNCWHNANEWNPDWNIAIHPKRWYNPISFIWVSDVEAVRNFELIRVNHRKGRVDNHHCYDGNGQAKIPKCSPNLWKVLNIINFKDSILPSNLLNQLWFLNY